MIREELNTILRARSGVKVEFIKSGPYHCDYVFKMIRGELNTKLRARFRAKEKFVNTGPVPLRLVFKIEMQNDSYFFA